MSTTKYIINNITGQTIAGGLTIDGNLNVVGSSISDGIGNYKALLTQTSPIVGTNLGYFNNGLIIGETYTITNYQGSDDFSNVANVMSGTINQTGCVFMATGQTPAYYSDGSELTSNGNLVVDELENNLGYGVDWLQISTGIYIGFPTIGTKYNNFPKNTTSVITQMTLNQLPFGLDYVKYYSFPGSFNSKDDVLVLITWDSDLGDTVSNTLYYTPVELKIKLNTDITPVEVSGNVVASYPFTYASVDLFCDGNYVESFYGDDVTVNNLTELVTQLNTNQATNYLGTYSEAGDGVLLTMPTNLVNRFCSNGTLTFEIFAD